MHDVLDQFGTPRFVALCPLDPESCQGGVDLTLRNEMIERVGEPGLSQIWRHYVNNC